MIRFSHLIKLLVFLFFLGLGLESFAQFSGGGRAGLNIANLRGSSVKNNKMIIGYNVGGFINYSLEDLLTGDLAEILSVQLEVSVQTKGTSSDYLVAAETVEENVKQDFTYVQFPLLAKFTFGDPRGIRYFGEAGPFLASLFGLTIDGEKMRDNDNNPDTDRRKYREEYSGFDYGLTFGGGFQLPFGGRKSPWEAYGNVRYSLGLANIGQYKEKTLDIPEEQLSDVKTSTISIMGGVIYKF
ncbi:MAG: PorT family protein [Bacteroidales bacterium]|nr:PorT family protein [Bacteroidales bacterium]